MKQILITCDTEVGELHANRADAFEIFIKGETCGKEVGVKLINDLANEYGGVAEHIRMKDTARINLKGCVAKSLRADTA